MDRNISGVMAKSSSLSDPAFEYQVNTMDQNALTQTSQEYLLQDAIESFHANRFLVLRNLPQNIDTDSIQEMLSKFEVSAQELIINPSSQTAKVHLSSGQQYELIASAIDLNDRFYLGDTLLSVSLSCNEHMLCVSQLPSNFNSFKFKNLVQLFGPVTSSFVMFNEELGELCNYGFVKYVSREVANQAKNLLFQKNIEGYKLDCDWLDSNLSSYKKLYSSCLHVDNLPPNYFNVMEFREIFSRIAKPPYCQIAMKGGRPIGFGIVEYNTPKDCMSSFHSLKDTVYFQDVKANLTFCAPGMRAINIINKLVNVAQTQEGLLPDPPAATAYLSQLQLMALQKPEVSSNILGMVSKEIRNIMRDSYQERPSIQSKQNISNDGIFKRPLRSVNTIEPTISAINYDSASYPPASTSADNDVINALNHHEKQTGNTFLAANVISNQSHSFNFAANLPPSMVNQFGIIPAQFQNQSKISFPVHDSAASSTSLKPQQSNLHQVFRKPLNDRTSPNENRFSPYVRVNKPNNVWDYSPVSSKTGNSRIDRGNPRERRVPHILPSPECSPDNLYVGQHSQGIGGHYADSYFRKKFSLI